MTVQTVEPMPLKVSYGDWETWVHRVRACLSAFMCVQILN